MLAKRSQVANEAIFVIGFLLLFFLLIFLVVSQRSSQFVSTKVNLEQRELCLKLASGINEVYSKGSGTVLRLDLKNHKVNFNGKEQVIEIDNKYQCNIPLKEISDGGSSIFEVDSGKIQLANIENIVYVNSNCVTNRVSFAQDNHLRVVTDLVRDSDNRRAKIDLARFINGTITNLTAYIVEKKIRLAYVTESSGVDVCTNNQLENYLTTDYQCKTYPNPSNTYCDKFTNAGPFWPLLNNYSIIFLENIGSVIDKKTELENWTNNGGALILLGKISDSAGTTPVILGIQWTKNQNPPSNITATSEYYAAVAAGREQLLFMGGNVTDPATWEPKRGHYVSNTTNALSFIKEGSYNTGQIGLARWDFGSGFSYFFSSCLESNNDDSYNFGNFTQRIREALQRMVGTYYSGYLDTKIINNEKIGVSVKNITVNIEHYMDGVLSLEELSIYNSTTNNYTRLCYLTSSSIDYIDTCTIQNSTLLGSEVRFRAGAIVNKINLDKSAYYDYQDLKVCYEEIT